MKYSKIHYFLVISGLFEIAKNQDKPLIGIDYVAEIVDKNSREINFSCILCDKNCNTKSIISHLVSHRHRMNYLVSNDINFLITIN